MRIGAAELQPPELRRRQSQSQRGFEAWLAPVLQTAQSQVRMPEVAAAEHVGGLSKRRARRTVCWHEASCEICAFFRVFKGGFPS